MYRIYTYTDGQLNGMFECATLDEARATFARYVDINENFPDTRVRIVEPLVQEFMIADNRSQHTYRVLSGENGVFYAAFEFNGFAEAAKEYLNMVDKLKHLPEVELRLVSVSPEAIVEEWINPTVSEVASCPNP